MYLTPEQIQAANNANVEALLAVANAQFSAFEKLANISAGAVKGAFEDSIANARALLSAKDVQEFVSLQNSFAQPAIGTYGNSGNNAYLGPGSRSIDLALVRLFRVSGSQRIEARVEAFNALNWLRPGNPNTTLSSATFGQILTAADPRIMQFGLKYQF